MPCHPALSPSCGEGWRRGGSCRQAPAGLGDGEQKAGLLAAAKLWVLPRRCQVVWWGDWWDSSAMQLHPPGLSVTQLEHFNLPRAVVSSALRCGMVTDFQCSQKGSGHCFCLVFELILKRIKYWIQNFFVWGSWDFSGFNVFQVEMGSPLTQEWCS